jgi:hypothetical protein
LAQEQGALFSSTWLLRLTDPPDQVLRETALEKEQGLTDHPDRAMREKALEQKIFLVQFFSSRVLRATDHPNQATKEKV